MIVTEAWKVIDRWWTDEPVTVHWAAIITVRGERLAVGYNVTADEWLVRPEPPKKGQ